MSTTDATPTPDLSLSVDNVGAIHDFAIKFDHGPGAYQLTGRSGSGKSTVLKSAAAMLKGKGAKLGASVADGERRGHIEGFGVRITLTPGRTKRSGEPEISSIEGRYDLGDFINPGYTDEKANDRKRIRAIINLTGIGPDLGQFRFLVPQGIELESVIDPETAKAADLIEMAAKLKRDFEAQARLAESALEATRNQQTALLAACEDVDLSRPCDSAELAAAHEAAIQARASLLAKDEAAAQSLETAAEAGRRLFQLKADRVGPTSEVALKAADQASQVLAEKRKAEQDALDGVERLKRQLTIAEAELQRCADARERANAEVEEADNRVVQAREYEKLLAELEHQSKTTAHRIPEEEIAAAQQRCEAAKSAIEQGAIVREARKKKAEAEALAASIKSAEHRAESWRDAAGGIDEALSNVVADHAPPGISVKIEDGDARLYYDYAGRGKIPFCELSEGEICRVALEVAIPAVKPGGFLTVEQEAWQGLQPANRVLIGQKCREAGIYMLTALVSDDESLHVQYID